MMMKRSFGQGVKILVTPNIITLCGWWPFMAWKTQPGGSDPTRRFRPNQEVVTLAWLDRSTQEVQLPWHGLIDPPMAWGSVTLTWLDRPTQEGQLPWHGLIDPPMAWGSVTLAWLDRSTQEVVTLTWLDRSTHGMRLLPWHGLIDLPKRFSYLDMAW